MQTLSQSQSKALSAFSMVKNGIVAGLDTDTLVGMVTAIMDEPTRQSFDAFMREDKMTYEAMAKVDLERASEYTEVFVQAQERVTVAAQALTLARQELDELAKRLPPSVQWTSSGFSIRDFVRQDTQTKKGVKTKERDETGSFQGKEPGFIYVPCRFKIVASAPLKDAGAYGTMRLLGSDKGRWVATATIDLFGGEKLVVEHVDYDPRKALDWAYTELAQVLIEKDIMSSEELGFLVYPGDADPVKRHKTTITNRPRDVMGADGYKKGSDYVELTGEDKYV